MSDVETYLVIGYTASARNLIDELRKLSDIEIIWVGEGETPDGISGIKIIDVKNPSWPDNVTDLTKEHQPRMIFLSPGAEQDLVNLTEGDNLERLLHQADVRLDGVPTIVISDEHQ